MFGIFKAIFSSSKDTSKIVDAAIGGIDSLFYTDQEKAEANMKVLDFKLEWAKATSGSNIARRFIAMVVTGIWSLWVLCILGSIVLSGFYNTIPTLTLLLEDFHVVSLSFAAIISWYFFKSFKENKDK